MSNVQQGISNVQGRVRHNNSSGKKDQSLREISNVQQGISNVQVGVAPGFLSLTNQLQNDLWSLLNTEHSCLAPLANSDLPQIPSTVKLGHWKFLVGHWTFLLAHWRLPALAARTETFAAHHGHHAGIHRLACLFELFFNFLDLLLEHAFCDMELF